MLITIEALNVACACACVIPASVSVSISLAFAVLLYATDHGRQVPP